MKVRITRCTNQDRWYRNNIGKIYKVSEDDFRKGNCITKLSDVHDPLPMYGYIDLKDCVQVDDIMSISEDGSCNMVEVLS